MAKIFNELGLMGRVITALILRETKTRFGTNRFGYLWALIEPASYIAIFLVVRSQLNASTPFGESLILFILTGLLTFRLFLSVASRGTASISSNKAMLAYPPVKPVDVIAARLILELLTMYVIFALFLFFLVLSAESKVIVNHHQLAGAIFSVSLLSVSVGFFNAVTASILPAWERIWNMLKLPLLLLSGVFYVPNSLPAIAQSVLSWNPVLHCVEWLRTATYVSYNPMLSKSYVLAFSLFVLAVAFSMERTYRAKILAS